MKLLLILVPASLLCSCGPSTYMHETYSTKASQDGKTDSVFLGWIDFHCNRGYHVYAAELSGDIVVYCNRDGVEDKAGK